MLSEIGSSLLEKKVQLADPIEKHLVRCPPNPEAEFSLFPAHWRFFLQSEDNHVVSVVMRVFSIGYAVREDEFSLRLACGPYLRRRGRRTA